jgi:hypothetical protein
LKKVEKGDIFLFGLQLQGKMRPEKVDVPFFNGLPGAESLMDPHGLTNA